MATGLNGCWGWRYKSKLRVLKKIYVSVSFRNIDKSEESCCTVLLLSYHCRLNHSRAVEGAESKGLDRISYPRTINPWFRDS